ncbi:MAG: deoxyribose-phosphate aldolase [Candidatus Thermoplasmatota archaeon]|nr:deoxyribose-phosphate aldolase [Candidatus Thermoplasmatota archaeon]
MSTLCDFTMLDVDGDLEAFLAEASSNDFAAICVLPEHVVSSRENYGGTIACAAGGFPNGNGPLHERIAEIKQAISDGADEIDIVLDFDALMEGDRDKVATDLAQIRHACGDHVLKVILETPELDLAYVELGARLALEFGADFIKTCTGRRGGCTPLDARVLSELLAEWSHENAGKIRGLKLSGGIREPGQAEGYLDIVRTALGDGFVHPATFRFGTSSVLIGD